MPTSKSSTKAVAKKVVAKKPVKKVAATKAVKKAAPKKTATRSNAKKPLVVADDQRSFWVQNGRILNSLVTLRDALDEMEKEVYLYHAGEAHNDFSKWVDEVLADSACAVDLSKAKTPKTAKSVVVKHLKFYAV